jgi:single-strand DNA-binding protein
MSAEIIAQYAKKGSSLYVEGRIQTRSWEKDGEKKYRTEIVADTFQFGPRPASSGMYEKSDSAKTTAGKQSEEMDTIEYPDENINPEDIPF